MGRIIQQNNGKTTIYVTGENFNNLSGTTDTYYVGVDLNTGSFEKKNPDGSLEDFGGSFTGATEVTYSEIQDLIDGSGLTTGSYYLITDFRTCYDQPDFDYNGNPIINTGITSNYKQGPIEPIMVLATGENTISTTAYQSKYPNDRIQYDVYYSQTEVTSGASYGRITERIDEFNNRTDYDHRTILFKRYRLFTHREELRINGTVEILSGGTVSGTNTTFSALTVGDVIYVPSTLPSYLDIVSISGNTLMTVSGDTIVTTGPGEIIYNTIEETNDSNGYFSYKRTNVKTNDYLEYTTFGDAIDQEYAKNNYVGNYANIYTNIDGGTFILANNVFLEGQYESNKFGDYCYNNTWGTDNQNNIWGDFCYENASTNDIDGNIIGHYFNRNIINVNMYNNQIGDGFNNNTLLAENGTAFENNVIGDGFNNNIIYSRFYDNQILNNFNYNTIGDFGNLNNFEFYRNRIGNYFNENVIRQYFQNNQIGSQFNNNIVNGNFYKNVIGNGFKNNPNIGYDFYGNHIGNAFNNNTLIGDYFHDNQIGENFNNNNNISYKFNNNQIGNTFENNTLGDTQYFNWDNTNIDNLTGRTYSTFNNSLIGDGGQAVGRVILGKELIMHFSRHSGTTITSGDLVIGETYEITNYQGSDDFSNVADTISGVINTNGCIFIATGTTPTEWSSNSELTELTSYDEYHKVKFTQWTQNNNGGGFSYERTKVYPTSEPTVYFTKTNYGPEIDVVVPNRLEIKRNNNGGIYNDVMENGWSENVSPEGTEWNSIYTQSYNGSSFEYNTIVNEFKGNYIRGDFQINSIGSYVGSNQFSGNTYQNQIGSYTFDNDFLGYVYDNSWMVNFNNNTFGNDFNDNTFGSGVSSNNVGNDFSKNNIQNSFYDNTIGNGFQTNQIGNYFNNNTIDDYFGYGYGAPQGNVIGNNFYNNTVGEYFYNNAIPDNFERNIIGEYFQWNVVNTKIDQTDFTLNYGNITGFSYTATGSSINFDATYTNVSTTTNGIGVDAAFNVEVSGGIVVGVSGYTEGRFYVDGDVLTILGTQINGVTGVIDGFSSDAVGKSGATGTYDNVFASGTGGENGSFNINVVSNLVDSITLSGGGESYLIGEVLTINGSVFGGVDGIDDITITVTSLYSDDVIITVTGTTPTSLFYEHYTKQIFERRLGNKRVSFYDEDDILNVDSVYESSGYIPVYSQSLTFPINYTSFEFECDGGYTNNGGTTSQTVNNIQELVTLFNGIFRSFGYFFDNNDGTLGLYINPSLKEQYCPNGVYTINVFND